MNDHDNYTELYVVSDLHLGGATNRQIFDQSEELAWLIDYVARREAPSSGPIGLVLNGDVVDFLAEEDAKDFDPEHAPAKLRRIMHAPEFAGVFDALRRLLDAPGHRLMITLGNHDVELALPATKTCLVEELCGGDDARRGRLVLALDGAGYPAIVGGRCVLCVHGNEADDWNAVDGGVLRLTAQALNARSRPPEWTGNAGTRLVVDVMNDIKRNYPVVDLFKPEGRALIFVLLALDPGQARKVRDLAPALLRLVGRKAGRLFGLLGGESGGGPATQPHPDRALAALVDSGPAGRPMTDARTRGGQLLREAEQAFAQERDPLQMLEERSSGGETLGAPGFLVDLLMRRSAQQNLREALQKWLAWDVSFAFSAKDDVFEWLDREVGNDVDILVAGHTHLERALRRSGTGVYFNSGTWARLIQLRPELLQDDQAFADVFSRFKQGTIEALEREPSCVLRRATVVAVCAGGSAGAYGELRHVERNGAGALGLHPVANTRLVPI